MKCSVRRRARCCCKVTALRGDVYDLRGRDEPCVLVVVAVDARYHSLVTSNGREKDNNIHPDIRRVFGSDVDRRGGGFAKCPKSFTIALAGCAVYGMLDGLSSNVSSGHNTKMYTAALGPSYMLYAIRMPHTYRYNPKSAGCCGCVTVISRVRQPAGNFFSR